MGLHVIHLKAFRRYGPGKSEEEVKQSSKTSYLRLQQARNKTLKEKEGDWRAKSIHPALWPWRTKTGGGGGRLDHLSCSSGYTTRQMLRDCSIFKKICSLESHQSRNKVNLTTIMSVQTLILFSKGQQNHRRLQHPSEPGRMLKLLLTGFQRCLS